MDSFEPHEPALPAMTAGETNPTLPPMVYVPAQRVARDGEAQLELRRLVDGRLVAVTYTTLERLVQGCGERQPWVLLPTPVLERYRDELGIEAVVLDAELLPERRHDLGDSDV
ncbi:MAG: SAV_915 family protein [Pseudonocardiaceae bacterium]